MLVIPMIAPTPICIISRTFAGTKNGVERRIFPSSSAVFLISLLLTRSNL